MTFCSELCWPVGAPGHQEAFQSSTHQQHPPQRLCYHRAMQHLTLKTQKNLGFQNKTVWFLFLLSQIISSLGALNRQQMVHFGNNFLTYKLEFSSVMFIFSTVLLQNIHFFKKNKVRCFFFKGGKCDCAETFGSYMWEPRVSGSRGAFLTLTHLVFII